MNTSVGPNVKCYELFQVGVTSDTSVKVTDLIKGSAYELRITARNRVGSSLPYVTEDPIIAGKRISKYLNNIIEYSNMPLSNLYIFV